MLIQFAEAQRAAGEAQYGSADGIADRPTASPTRNTNRQLTGNDAYKARLQAGETVQFRGGGNSLHPRIKSGECCKYQPVRTHEDVNKGEPASPTPLAKACKPDTPRKGLQARRPSQRPALRGTAP